MKGHTTSMCFTKDRQTPLHINAASSDDKLIYPRVVVFLACRKNYSTAPCVNVGVSSSIGISKMLKFYVEFFM